MNKSTSNFSRSSKWVSTLSRQILLHRLKTQSHLLQRTAIRNRRKHISHSVYNIHQLYSYAQLRIPSNIYLRLLLHYNILYIIIYIYYIVFYVVSAPFYVEFSTWINNRDQAARFLNTPRSARLGGQYQTEHRIALGSRAFLLFIFSYRCTLYVRYVCVLYM